MSLMRSSSPLQDLSDNEYSCIKQVLGDHHTHQLLPHQCSSLVVQRISAPPSLVWSLVRRFDNPQSYKHFIKGCRMQAGDGSSIGSIREVSVVSGLPASCSRERLELLDDEKRVLSFSVVGGEHRLRNYRSTTSVHECPQENGNANVPHTLVVESYVVDVPDGNTHEDTVMFVDTVIKCNLQSLATLSEHLSPANTEAQHSPL